MKKVISFILSLALIAGILPAWGVTANADGYQTQVFDFTQKPAEYLQVQTLDDATWAINKSMTDRYFWYQKIGGSYRANYDVYGLFLVTDKDYDRDVFTLDISVLQTGNYDISFQGAQGPNGGVSRLYIDNKYIGDYSFYRYEFVNEGEIKNLRSLYLTEGTHQLSFVFERRGNSETFSPYTYPRKLTLTGVASLSPATVAEIEMSRTSFAGGETEPYSIYIEQANGAKYRALPMLSGAPGYYVPVTEGAEEMDISLVSLNTGVATVLGDYVKGVAEGTAQLSASGTINGGTVSATQSVTINGATYDRAELDFEDSDMYIGGELPISVSAYLTDGSLINSRDLTVNYSVTGSAVTVADGKVQAVEAGTATISAAVIFNGVTKNLSKQVTVHAVSVASITASIANKIVSSFDADGEPIIVTGINNDGSEVSLTASNATLAYQSLTPDTVSVTAAGNIMPIKPGYGKVNVTATVDGESYSCELTVTSISGKSEPTIITNEMRANAAANVEEYSWARTQRDNAVALAEPMLANLDKVYDLIIPEGLPRSYSLAYNVDAATGYNCPYCGVDIREEYGTYGWETNPLQNPWKIQCPDCNTYFPTNDFGEFYKLGLDEHGTFHLDTAKAANDALIAEGEPGYLVNTSLSYADLKEKFPDITEAEAKTWGVDDGFGWKTGEMVTEQMPRVKGFIAYYMHSLWGFGGTGGIIGDYIDAFRDAYLYSGDIRFGRAGAILIDRMADVYPGYDTWPHSAPFIYVVGNRNRGKYVDYIWETDIAMKLAQAYDAFYPAFDDPDVIAYASAKSQEYNLSNSKTSAAMIRENCETGILREIYDACTEGVIWGNFGMHQRALAYAGCALDTIPETKEMLTWLGNPSSTEKDSVTVYGIEYPRYIKNTGGEILEKYIDRVDRDGFGDEVGTGYNQSWLSNVIEAVNVISDYSDYKGLEDYEFLDLYRNPKFVKMIGSNAFLSMGDGYTIQLGDGGSTASINDSTVTQPAMYGFMKTGNPLHAQIFATRNETGDWVGRDIFAANPGSLGSQMSEVIDECGPFTLKSLNLTGFGLATLRHKDFVYGTRGNGDIWMYYGRTDTSHSHIDKLAIGLDAYGFNFMPDHGYPASSTASDSQWTRATLSHNTVSVDGINQGRTVSGYPLHFDDAGKVKVMDVEAPDIYNQTEEYRRTVVMVQASDDVSYGVDFFRVKGGDEHVYSFHTQSVDSSAIEGLNLVPQIDGSGNYVGSYAGANVPFGPDPSVPYSELGYVANYPTGYTWLKKVRKDVNVQDGTFEVNFEQTDFNGQVQDPTGLNMRYHAVNDWTPSQVALATGETPKSGANPNIPELDYLLIHNEGTDIDTLFTSVLEPYKGERYIKSVEPATVVIKTGNQTANDVVKAVKVTHISNRVDYIIYATNDAVTYTVKDGDTEIFDFKGFVGVYSLNSGGLPVYSYVNDGTLIGEQESTARYTGEVEDFTRTLSFENSITVSLNEEIPEDVSFLADKYIYIDNGNMQNGSYRIKNAQISGNHLVLDIGDVSLVSSWNNMAEGTYNYNIAENQEFYIPLSSSCEIDPVVENLKIEYDFSEKIPWGDAHWTRFAQHNDGPQKGSVNYETTNGFYEYGGSDLSATMKSSTNQYGSGLGAGDFYTASNVGCNGFVLGKGKTATLKIRVPVSGNYAISQDFPPMAGNLTVYMSSVADGIQTGDEYKLFDLLDTSPAIATRDLDAGEYYLTYTNTVTTNGAMAGFGNLTLTIGEGTECVTMGAALAFDGGASLWVGHTKQANITYYNSVGEQDNPSDVVATYTSSDNNVATVDAVTGLVTAIAPGTADITATYETVGGVEVSASALVNVKAEAYTEKSGISVKYDIESVFSGTGTVALSTASYENTHNFWKYHASNYNTTTLCSQSSSVFRANSGVNITGYSSITSGIYWADTWFAIKIKVPKAGLYTPKQTYGSAGAATEMHIIPVPETDLTEQEMIHYVKSDSFKLDGASAANTEVAYGDVSLEVGEYYVIWSTDNDVRAIVDIKNFTLDGSAAGDKSGDALMDGSITFGSDLLLVDETTTVTVTGYLSSTGAAATGFTYDSSDNSVATVTNDGTITALKGGTTTISALIGGTVVATKDIKVRPEIGIKIAYGFSYNDSASLFTDYTNLIDGNNGSKEGFVNPVSGANTDRTRLYLFRNYEQSLGFWRYANLVDTTNGAVDGGSQTWGSGWQLATTNWVALSIYVPKSTMYDVTIEAANTNDCEAVFDYYVLPGGLNKAQIAERLTATDPSFGAEIDCSVLETHALTSHTKSNVELQAGENLVVFKLKSNATGHTYLHLKNIILTEGDGSLGVPMGVTKPAQTSLVPGGTTTVSLGTTPGDPTASYLYNSKTWARYSPIEVSYISSNPTVASVDDSGIVTAHQSGQTTITAVVDGTPLVGSVIEVGDSAEPNTAAFVS